MFILEDRVYFDGAAAADAVEVKDSSSESSAPSGAEAGSSDSSENSDSASGNSASSSHDSSQADSSAGSSATAATDVDSLISAILNGDASLSGDASGADVMVVSSSADNASELIAAAQAQNFTIVSYDPSTESLSSLLSDIRSSLDGGAAASINFITADNGANGFSLVAGEATTLDSLSAESPFWSGLSGLLSDGGVFSISGDASLSSEGHSALETAIADATGHEVSFIDASTGEATYAFAESQDINVYFIDSKVMGIEDLLKDLPTGAEVHYLSGNGDGVAEISAALAGRSGIDSIHIISHGSDGELLLGGDILDSSTMGQYAEHLQSWGHALSKDGDILLYGCDIASSDHGKAFVAGLANLTGADVAASTDGTGTAAGNWTLEFNVGDVQTASAFHSDFQYHLATLHVTNNADSGAGSLRAQVDGSASGDTIIFDGSYHIDLLSTITIPHELSINGMNYSIVVDGAGFVGSIFNITSSGLGTVSLSRFSIINSSATAVYVTADHVVISGMTFIGNGNSGTYAGALTLLNSTSTLDIYDSNFSQNSGWAGGAITCHGIMTIKGSSFKNNMGIHGGAIFVYVTQTLSIENCSFGNNIAEQDGGAIYNEGILTINSSSLAINHTSLGIHGGGIYTTSSLTIKNSILADNYAGTMSNYSDIYRDSGTVTSNGYNIVEYAVNCSISSTGDVTGNQTDIWEGGVAVLAMRGGPTATFGISSTGVAYHKIAMANGYNGSPDIDQRGYYASVTENRDIGAYQYGLVAPITGDFITSQAASGNWGDASNWQTYDGSYWISASVAPSTSEVHRVTVGTDASISTVTSIEVFELVIANGSAFSLGTDLTVNGNLTIGNGALAIGAHTLTLDTATVSGDGTLTGGATSNLTWVGANAEATSLPTITNGLNTLTLTNSSSLTTLTTYASLALSGSGAFSIGDSSLTNLTINRSGETVSLNGNLAVNNILALTAGILALGSYDLTLGTAATISGTPSSSNMIAIDGAGALYKEFAAAGSFLFPVGTTSNGNEYSPLTVNFASGTFAAGAKVGVSLSATKETNIPAGADNYLNRYWTVSSSGISDFAATVTAQYLASDVTGSESYLSGYKYSGGEWTQLGTIDAANHTFSGDVSSFSDFTAYGTTPPEPSNNTDENAFNNDQSFDSLFDSDSDGGMTPGNGGDSYGDGSSFTFSDTPSPGTFSTSFQSLFGQGQISSFLFAGAGVSLSDGENRLGGGGTTTLSFGGASMTLIDGARDICFKDNAHRVGMVDFQALELPRMGFLEARFAKLDTFKSRTDLALDAFVSI